MTVGLVLTGRNNIFSVQIADAVVLCRFRGKRLALDERSYNPLAPGDRVEVGSVDAIHETGVIERRLERQNAFVRFNLKRSAPQTLAANLDCVYCVTSVAEPPFRPRFVDRFLALAEDQGLPAAIVVNKTDLDRTRASTIVEDYQRIGYSAFAVSSPDALGIEELRDHAGTGIAAFIGQSGVGKSTLLNELFGSRIQSVGEVSPRYLRGRHTTNAARLVQGEGMRVVDTPGIRDLDVRTINSSSLDWCFVEFREFLGSCGHADCAHAEESDCAVQRAVAAGSIGEDRYESYLRLYAEILDLEMTT